MKLSTIVAFLPFCTALAIPKGVNVALDHNLALVPRQASAAFDVAFEWFAEVEGELEEESITESAEVELTPSGGPMGRNSAVAVQAGDPTMKINTKLEGNFGTRIFVHKLNQQTGFEGWAEALWNRLTRRFDEPFHMSPGLPPKIRGVTATSSSFKLIAPR
ncbi:unnamed protein product [Zymoseptoria tritici ST99CH_3D1]|nr:unnamed protein product [Zymoseptoria tritici ST99CH_3D1]